LKEPPVWGENCYGAVICSGCCKYRHNVNLTFMLYAFASLIQQLK
jgi:hypothetical protein